MEQMENIYLTKHRQIIDAFSAKIQGGALKPYNQLPTERELCEQWQVSLSTVRKAMDLLTDRRKIFRVPGKGSFVAFPKITQQTSQVLSFTEKMTAQGLEVETKLIEKEVIEPSEEVSLALQLTKPARALKIQRLRIVKGEPMVLQTAFMPANICTNLIKEDLETKSLNRLFEEQFNIRLSRSEVWIEAPIISRREQKLLGNPRVPLFWAVVGVTFDQYDKPVRFSRDVFRGDRVRLKISDSSVFELNYSCLLQCQ
ncbi:MAG: GntR family transcriptional regulator [Desulfobacterium sp.]|nr:GntR family transcriptional regulator [Desulfobacterium sp.]